MPHCVSTSESGSHLAPLSFFMCYITKAPLSLFIDQDGTFHCWSTVYPGMHFKLYYLVYYKETQKLTSMYRFQWQLALSEGLTLCVQHIEREHH